jgi:hypothetical protein
MSVGRPSEYTPEIIAEARAFFNDAVQDTSSYPSIAGLALHLNLSRETIYAWSAQPEKAEFSDIVADIMTLQELRLSENGLKGIYNATITKLMLSKHGFKDATDITSQGEKIGGFNFLKNDNADYQTGA